MRMLFPKAILVLLFLFGFTYANQAIDKVSGEMKDFLIKSPSDSLKVWIFFKDKGLGSKHEIEAYLNKNGSRLVTLRAQERRKKKQVSSVFIEEDIPLNPKYLKAMKDLGIRIRSKSRYVNAVSAYIKLNQLKSIEALPFVTHLQRVAQYNHPKPIKVDENLKQGQTDPFYGSSYGQLQMMGVPAAQTLGFTGKGILIAMLDTGFMRDHEALKHVNVLAEYDFINNQPFTGYDPRYDSHNQPEHGTMTLSTIAGYAPGKLIGPAFEAQFVLAKTEYVPNETPVEEDYWVAGLEWADSLGADVLNSSLGYRNFWSGTSYTYQDMDGHTAVTSIAAYKAATKSGILICNSIGNEGNDTLGTLIAPADADSIISVGGVNYDGHLAAFSSTGPTYGGGSWPSRIKPDLVAQASGVYFVIPYTTNEYMTGSGTSFSSPLTCGSAALLMQAYPNLKLKDYINLLKDNADKRVKDYPPFEENNSFPNNYYGWGITYIGNLLTKGRIYAKVYDAINGKPVEGVSVIISGPESKSGTTSGSGGFSSEFTRAGSYLIQVSKNGYSPQKASIEYDGHTGIGYTFNLYKSDWQSSNKSLGVFPNPSTGELWFSFELIETKDITIKIYSTSGRFLKELSAKNQAKGIHANTSSGSAIYWNCTDKDNNPIKAGVYFYIIKIGSTTDKGKFIILR